MSRSRSRSPSSLRAQPHPPSSGLWGSNNLPQRIASLVLSRFDALPRKAKPRAGEWIPLSGIVIAKAPNTPAEKLWCVCLATGTKTLPRSAIPLARGRVLHDSHAEILALRAFNYFLLQELERIVSSSSLESSHGGAYDSPFLEWVEQDVDPLVSPSSAAAAAEDEDEDEQRRAGRRPFKLQTGLTVHLFSTEPPCGDASMESLIDAREPEGAVPWTRLQDRADGAGEDNAQNGSGNAGSHLQGRGYFSELGVVRRKPARGDAEVSWSKSCSDKLAVRECLGVLNGIVGALVEAIWLKSLVLPFGKADERAMIRAFGRDGRLSVSHGERLPGCYKFRPFEIEILSADSSQFLFAKAQNGQSKAGNVASVWTTERDGEETKICEVLINGVKQGYKQTSEDSRKGSVVCKENMWRKGREIIELLRRMNGHGINVEGLRQLCSTRTYAELKEILSQSERSRAKEIAIDILGRWYPNQGDEDWGLEALDGV